MFQNLFQTKSSAGPKLRVVLIGGPSSGKTTMLALLSRHVDRDSFPEDVGRQFDELLNGLNGQKRPIASTPFDPDLPKERVFPLVWNDKRLELTTFDYAGETATAWLSQENETLTRRLAAADAVILLVDSFSLCRAGSWEEWSGEQNGEFMLKKIRTWLSDRHRGNLPFAVICSRSDLAPQDRLEEITAQIRSACRTAGLVADVLTVSAFGQHANDDELPPGDSSFPPEGFLVPREEVSACPKPILELFWDLSRQNRSRRKANPVLAAIVAIGLVVILSFLAAAAMNRQVSIGRLEAKIDAIQDVGDDAQVREAFPEVPTRDGEPAIATVYRFYSDKMTDGADDDRQTRLRGAYLAALKRTLQQYSSGLSYSLERGKWEPAVHWAFVERARSELQAEKRMKPVEKLLKTLAAILDKIPHDNADNTESSVRNLVDGYAHAGLDIPLALRKKLEGNIRWILLAEIRNELRRSGLEDLYKKRIPSVIARIRQYPTTESTTTEMNSVQEYCRIVGEIKQFKCRVRSYERRGLKTDDLDIKIYVDWNDDGVGDRFIPNHGATTGDFEGSYDFKNRPDICIPFAIDSTPIEIVIEDYDGWGKGPARIVRWSSKKLSQEIRNRGYSLPGLEKYMVFKDCMAFKAGKEASGQDDYTKIESKLVIEFTESFESSGERTLNGERILSPPELLLEANREE